MKINKATVVFIILIVWTVFSLIYIIVDAWRDFQINQLQQAFNQGSASAITQIFSRTENCQPVNLFSGDQEINLIRTDCLKQEAEGPQE